MSLDRERRTVAAMMRIYCDGHHPHAATLCDDCQSLLDYAIQRLSRCPFQENKPICADCAIHCYQRDMRQRVREVMRYAGPRMFFRHPVLAIGHLLDKRRPRPQQDKPLRRPSQPG
jgi:hypothetical protein